MKVIFFIYYHRVATHSGNSGNFKVEENLRETQGNSRNLDLFFKLKKTQGSFDFF